MDEQVFHDVFGIVRFISMPTQPRIEEAHTGFKLCLLLQLIQGGSE